MGSSTTINKLMKFIEIRDDLLLDAIQRFYEKLGVRGYFEIEKMNSHWEIILIPAQICDCYTFFASPLNMNRAVMSFGLCASSAFNKRYIFSRFILVISSMAI